MFYSSEMTVVANLQPEQIDRVVTYTANLIQFSWTASALLLTAQGWLVSKLYFQNRNFKVWHLPVLLSCGANIVGMICLLSWYELIVAEAMKEKVDFFRPEIECWRSVYYWSLLASIILFGVGFCLWASFKSKLEKSNLSTADVK